MADHNITLYISEMSPPARCVAYFLQFHKIDSVKIVNISLAAKDHKTEWYTKLNPQATVPLLRDETSDVTLYESTAMLEYFCELFDKRGLFGLPTELSAKYSTINALHNAHNFSVKANLDVMDHWYAAAFEGVAWDLEVFKAAVQKQKETRFKLLEEMLTKNGGFIAGKEATCADLRVWTDLFQLSNLGGEATLGMLDFAEFPTITSYLKYGYDAFYAPQKDFWEPVVGYYQWATGVIGTNNFRLAEKTE